jgi:cysteine-rich repeat protein
VIAVLALALGACQPRLQGGQFTCSPSTPGTCPYGWVCLPRGVEHRCFREVTSVCGNGIIEAGEQCDGTAIPDLACPALGYAGGTPACLSFCVLVCSGCGNGVVNPGETCDEGKDNSDLPNAACRTDCQERRCGDGILDADEACDDGEDNGLAPGAFCRPDCRPARCGDGVVDPGETCDDGARAGGDGCGASCRVEDGFTCLGEAPSTCLPVTFAALPAGTFLMGSPAGELGRRSNEAQRSVALTRGFEIQTTEVTRREFRIVMGYDPSLEPTGGDDHPVDHVTWHEAAAFTNALSDLAGLERCYDCAGAAQGVVCTQGPQATPYDCAGYRLPTEAEWEYAARAGAPEATYNGEILHTGCSPVDPTLDPIAFYCGNADDQLHPVASKLPNAWGLYDLLGNAFEWVHDWDRRPTSPPPPAVEEDPWGIPNGYYRILRGGCSWCYAWATRAALREPDGPRSLDYPTGLRPARTRP